MCARQQSVIIIFKVTVIIILIIIMTELKQVPNFTELTPHSIIPVTIGRIQHLHLGADKLLQISSDNPNLENIIVIALHKINKGDRASFVTMIVLTHCTS